ncbi:hypothetical protein HDU76_012412 [Blyttiomyces sp. JEL0837]|nr:hypothetical protein HDU76_012412 [Blyttiomyces sp. JEL0837]
MTVTSNKAFVSEKKGDISAQGVKEWPVPTLGDTDVLIKIESAGRNPTVLGSDAAGVVAAVGPKVTQRKVGDRVWYQGQIGNVRTSTFQQYAALDEKFAIPLPENISFDEGATLGVAVSTAYVGLYHPANLALPKLWEGKKAEGHILVWGASSSVGHIIIQLAKKSGLTVIATASPQNHALVKSLGADHVFDYKSPTVVDDIRKIVNDNLQYAYDTVGSLQAAFDLLSSTKPAHAVSIAAQPDSIKKELLDQFTNKKVSSLYGSVHAHPDLLLPALKENFVKYLSTGEVKPQAVKVLGGLKEVAAGQADQIAGKVSSVKLVVHPFQE